MPRAGRAAGSVGTKAQMAASRDRQHLDRVDEADFERQPLNYSAHRLAEVSREIGDWVPVLRRLAETEVLRDLALGHCTEISGAAVRSIIAARRLRDEYFWPAMAEAAWAMLLHLFATRLEGRRLDVAGLGKAADLPPASARHWIDWLAGRGMICRAGEGEDGGEEATMIDLTEAGADEMRAYLLASLRLSPWIQ